MLIPYNTDAPIYHFPFATIGLILVNLVAFAIRLHDPSLIIPYLLEFGNGLHPVQWVTNNFLHAGYMHILGNMFFLWGFGLVVEGKLGWWRFLIVYLLIATIYGAIIQMAMLGASEGGALGASGALFGLLVISLVWAPKNEMSCFLWLFRPFALEMPITVFATIYLVMQFVVAWLTGFSMSSAMLHLTGAAIGAVFGVALLRFDWVDCEGWDLFALWKGTLGEKSKQAAKMQPKTPKTEKLGEQHAQLLATSVTDQLKGGDAAGAARFYRKQRELRPSWELSGSDLMALIQATHKQKLWAESVPPMFDYIRQFPDKSLRVRLKLAQILIDVMRQPVKASKLLSAVSATDLPPELRPAYNQLLARAEASKANADIEFADED